MKEKTRKGLAIWMIGIGLLISAVTLWLDLHFAYLISTDLVLPMLIGLLLVWVFLWGGISVLKKLQNAVIRVFFKRFLFCMVVLPFIRFVLIVCFGLNEVGDGVLGDLFIGVTSLAGLIVLMSGAAVISSFYQLNSCLSSRLRLFRIGILLMYMPVVKCLYFIPHIDYIDYCMGFDAYRGLEWFDGLYGLVLSGLICLFIGLAGIIRSDLLGETCQEDVLIKIKGGWKSRPVVGAVCFYLCMFAFMLLIFIFLKI